MASLLVDRALGNRTLKVPCDPWGPRLTTLPGDHRRGDVLGGPAGGAALVAAGRGRRRGRAAAPGALRGAADGGRGQRRYPPRPPYLRARRLERRRLGVQLQEVHSAGAPQGGYPPLLERQ